jgi:predicted nucleic acid-binding Zn finger protein
MTTEFSDRLTGAKQLVDQRRVKKYLIEKKVEYWVVVGNTREYLVFISPFWCRCYDFQHRIMTETVVQCKHILAVQLAVQENQYDTLYLSKEEYDFIRPYFLFSA